MLFFSHLVIGLIAGFILYEFFHDRMIIVYVAAGSVLPDIIDKPLGYIVLGSTLDNGKIFFHSLIIVFLFFLTGLIVWKYYRSPAFLFIALGISLHQILDRMWLHPVNWYYPLLGPFETGTNNDYFMRAITTELTSGTEWILFAGVLAIACWLVVSDRRQRPAITPDPLLQDKDSRFKRNFLVPALIGLALFVLVLSLVILWVATPSG